MTEIKKIAEGMDETDKMRLANKLSSSLGISRFDVPRTVITTDNFGLCTTCKSFTVIRSQYKILFAKCFENNLHLSSDTPVTECSTYDPIGMPSLNEMLNMAWDIDPDRKAVGFEVKDGG